MNLTNIKRLMRHRFVPHLAFPKTDVTKDIIDNYRFMPLTEERIIHCGSIETKEVIRVSAKTQKQIFKALLMNPGLKQPYIVGISSTPTDLMALEVAGYITQVMIKRGLSWTWINSATFASQTNSEFVVIHNVFSDVSAARLQQIRDIITAYPNAIRLVVMGGMDSLHFFDKKLNMSLSGIMHVDSIKSGTLVDISKYEKAPVEEIDQQAFNRDIYPLLDGFFKQVQ